MKPIFTFLLLALLILACSRGRMTTSERAVEGPDGSYSTGASYSLHSDKNDARLERAAAAATQGNYQVAIDEYGKVHRSNSAKGEQKEKALFGLGSAWSNLLNSNRDFERALEYLEKLVERYPDSELRPKAEDKIATIRGITD